jgi:hypothetical protein
MCKRCLIRIILFCCSCFFVRSYYEDRLDEDARPKVTDDYQMEQFIRAKYEKKRWAGKGNGPKPLSGQGERGLFVRFWFSEKLADETPPPSKSPKADRGPIQAPSAHAANPIHHAAPPQQIQNKPVSAESLLFAPNISAAPAATPQVPAYVLAAQSLVQQPQQPSLSKVLNCCKCFICVSFVLLLLLLLLC